MTDTAIAPADLDTCLRVIAALDDLPVEHPDAVAVRRATARLFKTVKERRRSERRRAVLEADAAVTAATATAAPGRIDDETQGLALKPAAAGASAGTLLRARACYVCKRRYHEVDAFYHQLCPDCAASHHARRDARTDLTGRRALLTGGRAKIGMYIALRLLRDGAHTTITTRFPRDAARRFAAMPDSAQWLERLRIIGIDLRNPAQVVALADTVARAGAAGHPHQQRRADRAPLARGLRAARGRRGGAARRGAAAVDAHPRPGRHGASGRRREGRRPPLDADAARAHRARADRGLGVPRARRRGARDRRGRPAFPTCTRPTAGPTG